MYNIMGENITITQEDYNFVNQLMKQYYEQNTAYYESILDTKISKDKSIELMLNFFKTISINLYNFVINLITNKTGLNFVYQPYQINPGLNNQFNEAYVNLRTNIICVPIRGDLRDVYALVHEITHTFDIKNGDNSTRKLYGEVAPQCMERLLDKYLLSLSDFELEYYGFDKEKLNEDVKKREITTFLSRIGNFNSVVMKRNNEKSIRYVLAQLYSIILKDLDFNTCKRIILDFIKAVEANDIHLFFSKYNFKYSIQDLIDLNIEIIKELSIKEMIK